MPRIYNRDRDPLDFCRRCFDTVLHNKTYSDDVDDEIDADHPPYEDTDYRCERCNKTLTAKDD